MATTIEGNLLATGLRFAIVIARWNDFIANRLLEGAIDTIARHGGNNDSTAVVKVPGSFEIPMVAHKIAATGKYDAVICLGVLIRGATTHFDWISSEATKGIANASNRDRRPDLVRRADDRYDRAGDRAGGNQSRQQGP